MTKEIRLPIADGEVLIVKYEDALPTWRAVELYHSREIQPEGADKPAVYFTNLSFLVPSFNAGTLMVTEHLDVSRMIRIHRSLGGTI